MAERCFKLAVRAVVLDKQGHCLLMRRSAMNTNMVGQWEWPGGKVDPGEDFVTALHRELAEETGLTIEITGLAGATEFELPAKNLHVIMLCMEASQTGGTLALSHEHDAAEWVALSELSKYELVTQTRAFMLDYAANHQST